MFSEQKVIYVARTVQDAYLLKNLLSEERISAVVLNEALEGGAGVDILGWPTAARVVVAEADAERARPIAVRFDRKLASQPPTAGGEPPAQPSDVLPPWWPACPECDTPRWTRCSACGTEGTRFQPADQVPLDVLAAGASAEAASECSCGPAGCTPATPIAVQDVPTAPSRPKGVPPEQTVPGGAGELDTAEPMLICPTCDEPFRPQYRRTCASCGHRFPDGYEPDGGEPAAAKSDARVLLAIAAIVLLLAAMGAYLIFLF